MMPSDITICAKCIHFKNLEPSGPRKDVWYNHLCKASKRMLTIDPVTGRNMYAGTNSLGGQYFAGEQFLNCRDINTDGNCHKWGAAK